MTPALAAPYPAALGAPTTPLNDAMLMMRPGVPSRIMASASACMDRTVVVRFWATT